MTSTRDFLDTGANFAALIPRRDKTLNAPLEVLDARFLEAPEGPRKFTAAWESLQADELKWIGDITYKCRYDLRFYLENFHIVKDQEGMAQTLYPLWDSQEVIFEALERKWKEDGCYRLIVLKPRQCGGTIVSGGVIFQATIFNPRMFTIMMAQSKKTTGELYRRLWDAYNSLPWWMRPELESKVQEDRFVFQRSDPNRRVTDPGLASTLVVANAQEQAGVAIGKTIACGHFSEASRYPPNDMWTADIEPSMNARNTRAIMESTAYGRGGLFYNMWIAAEKGENDWTPVFIPVYRVRRYSLPIRKGDDFTLTNEERGLREKVAEVGDGIGKLTIPNGFFNWQRRKIKAYIAAEHSSEGLYKYQEAFPVTPGVAFISSGFCAFPRHCLAEQEAEFCRPPIWIGEVNYIGPDQAPEFHPPLPTLEDIKQGIVSYRPEDIHEKPEHINRLWLWELPSSNDGIKYYSGVDVAGGMGPDFSCAQIIRLGFSPSDPRVQVAMWHGWCNPSHFARILAALGYWYNTAEIAVEYMKAGVTTGDELLHQLDYPNLYRWRHEDKIGNTLTQHVHWQTVQRTRENAINRVNEGLLDRTLHIRNKLLIEEMRNFGRLDGESKAEGFEDTDDATMALVITLGASSQAKAESTQSASSTSSYLTPRTPKVWGVYDHLMRQIDQSDSEEVVKKVIHNAAKQYNGRVEDILGKSSLSDPSPRVIGWKVIAPPDNSMIVCAREIMVMEANTPYSPIYDANGAEHELHFKHGVPTRQVMPEIVQLYRAMLTTQHYEGDD
jgi:hypothetical protein